jgi:primosomal protein N' (replication factor Y)
VFAPLEPLGLIVVDEEHESAYKEPETPRYHARDVAIVRGSQGSAVVLLGSATPSAESYHNARLGKYQLLELPSRVDNVPMPEIAIVDMTAERKREYAALKASLPPEQRAVLKEYQQGSISSLLREKIEDRLSRGEGIILLQNRRGFAPFVECPECGYTESCSNCNVTMTYHSTRHHLRCHYCGAVRRPYIICPSCGGSHAMLHGIGTQRVEEDLARLFPSARVLRMDLDTTTRKGSHMRILRKFGAREADILLGTQMVAKGLDFPHVTLVGVVSADTQMLLPDFRSSERTFQLLTQVAGRAGRSTLRGEVLIQTHQPRHYTLTHVVDSDFHAFYEEEMVSRQDLLYPPYARLVLIELKGPDEARVQKAAESFARLLRPKEGTYVLLGPAPAVVSRIQKQYRWHIILKSPKQLDGAGQLVRHSLEKARAEFERAGRRDVRLIIDIDPVGLM